MLTQNEISSLSLSPTKKDFVQIWNELLDVAGKLSERWDPTSTNESDPGIVILKALTGIADKLNYNIDKNTLEAFMPTAAQEDSMRKLCDMLGYNMKYYQSAQTEVVIKYHNSDPSAEEQNQMRRGLIIPKFTVVTNSDQDVSYFTLDTGEASSYLISADKSTTEPILCMEGQIVKCESTNENNIITANQISENNRFYLPETQIAENGIFIYNVFNNELLGGTGLDDGLKWTKVDNLNVQEHNSRVYKFGFDSYEGRPYIEFPDDYSELFNDGIFIYYARTNGASGNVSAKTLTMLQLPTIEGWSNVSAESFSVENAFSATSGANLETIKQAYNNFKKTIGTFETLVTCRDYMNKIYTMVDSNNRPLVSNILVTDIRNDLNRAVTICSCDDAGIFYKETPIVYTEDTYENLAFSTDVEVPISTEVTIEEETPIEVSTAAFFSPVFNDAETAWYLGELKQTTNDFLQDAAGFVSTKNGTVSTKEIEGISYWVIIQDGKEFVTKFPTKISSTQKVTLTKNIETTETVTVSEEKLIKTGIKTTPAIDHFDLVLYPFKSYSQIRDNVKNIRKVYDASFNINNGLIQRIDDLIKNNDNIVKTLAHNFIPPRVGDIISINNYLRLNAIIATNSKITVEEGDLLKDKIKIALANAFNMRELDFGEEIPFDSIVEVIEKADSRIRIASLNEPALYTTFSICDKDTNGNLIVKEYAVGSDWLTLEEARETDRFNINKLDKDGKSMSTFDTAEAKKIYNKLALRNILAGRVPLFKYNNTFKASFSEGAYQVTISNPENIPAELPQPTSENPFTIYTTEERTYTGQYADESITYTETYTPEEYVDNVITLVDNDIITDITTSCEIFSNIDNAEAAPSGVITDVKLEPGEFVKFRSPNLTTNKTYPAYVNYHLDLASDLISGARPAKAESLYALLNKDRNSWSTETPNIGWEKALEYFRKNTNYVKTIPLTQTISKYSAAAGTSAETCEAVENPTKQHVRNNSTGKCTYCGKEIYSPIQKGPITVSVNNLQAESDPLSDLYALLEKSGCIKLTNANFKARLTWSDQYKDEIPEGSEGPDLDIRLDLADSNPFITSPTVLDQVIESLNIRLNELIGQTKEDGKTPILPTECAWTIHFDFEGVPFDQMTLAAWETFIKNNSKTMLGFAPVAENDIIFWRLFGEGYSIGKYVLEDTRKLLKFERNYFTLLPNSPLQGIYLVEDLGSNEEPRLIKNGEEYKLRPNEYLYIEYTPSSTSDEGTTQDLPAKKEILGPGTIIKPTGFEVGLTDSTVYAISNSPHKTVTFEKDGTEISIAMHRFGANEQVEIRELAQVVLDENAFESSSSIYYYKNFNNCDALEKLEAVEGKRVNNVYTLKDGEYIFYTDSNKAELAYFTTGTQVTLGGNLVLEQFDIIELSSIFESGLQAIPWQYLNFTGNNKITFQEFKYITLGEEDTIKEITLKGDIGGLNGQWQPCDSVIYTLAGSTDSITLPKVSIFDDVGCGWEACSIFELDVSANKTQTLRNNGQVKTGISLVSTSPRGGGKSTPMIITPEYGDSPISFKTNLICQTSSAQLNIDDVLSNPKKLKGFEFKIFALDEPTIVQTEPGKVVPYHKNNITDLTNWPGTPHEIKSYSDLWKSVTLETIKAVNTNTQTKVDYDKALRLPISTLPDTYGIFSIYLDYTQDGTETDFQTATWIEILPGTDRDNITLLNVAEKDIKWETADEATNKSDKLFLKPGINCIRVKKTSRLFIKTSKESQGTLFFDELKLVDCQTIKSEGATKTTQGLNIDQIGYLNPIDSSTLDAEARKELKASYINTTYSGLNELNKEATQAISLVTKEVSQESSKVNEILSFVRNAKNELAALLDLDSTQFTALVDSYLRVSSELLKEKTLLDILNTNSTGNTETLEQELVDVLENFSTLNDIQQQLFEELLILKTRADTQIKELSKESILEDFNNTSGEDAPFNALDNAEFTKLAEALVIACSDFVDAYYSEQLVTLAASIENVADSEERTRVLNALNTLKEAHSASKRTELLNKIRQLVQALDNTELTTLADNMRDAATQVDYSLLYATLIKLQDYLKYRDFNTLAAELESVANSGNDEYLNTLVTTLQGLLTSSSSIITSGLIDLVKTNVTATEPVDSITTEVMNIYKQISEEHQERLSSLLTELYNPNSESESILDSLADMNSVYNEAITKLQNSKDSQVTKILDKLDKIIAEREAYAALITDLSTVISNFGKAEQTETATLDTGETDDSIDRADVIDAIEILPFHDETVIAVWTDYLKQILATSLKDLYINIYNLIKAMSTETGSSSSNTIVPVKLKNLVDMKAFENLIDRVQDLKQKNTQNESRKGLINTICTTLAVSSELSDAMDMIINDESSSTIFIKSLITELCDADTLTEKRKLISVLKEELVNNITVDTKLVSMCAELLCPSILLYEKKLLRVDNAGKATDKFFEPFVNYLFNLRKALKGEASLETNIEPVSAVNISASDWVVVLENAKGYFEDCENALSMFLETLKNHSETQLKVWLYNSLMSFKSTSMLPVSFLDRLTSICQSFLLKDTIIIINETKLENFDSTELSDWLETLGSNVDQRIVIIIEELIKNIKNLEAFTSTELSDWLIQLSEDAEFTAIQGEILAELIPKAKALEALNRIDSEFKNVYNIALTEELLLKDLHAIDINRDFYYTAPTDLSLAIDFNDSNNVLNTLMNPAINYDINNINNNFVISKLDIDYLDQGIQIARASRLN